MLTSYSVENIKAFRDPTTVELAPITLFIGKNSAGKSALARFPLVVARSLGITEGPPLLLSDGGLDYAESLLDLAYLRSPSPLTWQMTFDPALTCSASLLEINQESVVQRLCIEKRDGDNVAFANWTLRGHPGSDGSANYDIRTSTAEESVVAHVDFRAGLPSSHIATMQDAEALLKEVRSRFVELYEKSTYLGPIRRDPQRSYRFEDRHIRDVGTRGEFAPDLLRRLGGTPGGDGAERLAAISDWFEEHLGQRLIVQREGNKRSFSLVLQSRDESRSQINLFDTGHGLGQVLPLIVHALATPAADDGGISVIEQPELHLHPAAHRDIADLMIQLHQHRPRHRILVETHSENLLLRLRRRIVDETLMPTDVRVYWIEPGATGSVARRIDFNAEGTPTSWPKGVFSEDYEELLELRRALKRRDSLPSGPGPGAP